MPSAAAHNAPADGAGRINIRSSVRGLLRIDTDALLELNPDQDIGVFTHYDGVAVNADTMIAGVKIAPIAMDSRLDASLPLSSDRLWIAAVPTAEGRLHRHRSPAGRVRDRFEQTLHEKMDWYGADLQHYLAGRGSAQIAGKIQATAPEVDLIFTAGSHSGSSIRSSLHSSRRAELVRLGARARQYGVGGLAQPTNTPILSLASCGMFSRSTVADLLIPYVFAGERITNETFARLGHGGLLDRGMDWRFLQVAVIKHPPLIDTNKPSSTPTARFAWWHRLAVAKPRRSPCACSNGSQKVSPRRILLTFDNSTRIHRAAAQAIAGPNGVRVSTSMRSVSMLNTRLPMNVA